MLSKNNKEGVKDVLRNILSTEYGKAFFKWFELESGYNASSLVIDSNGRINTDAVIVNEAIRRFYLNIRNFMSLESRKEIADFDLELFFKKIQKKEDEE